MSMASKKTDSATNPKMTFPSPGQQQSQSQQRSGHAGHSLASGRTEEASDRAFQNVDDLCGFDSPGMDGECGLRAIEGQRDEDTMPSLDLYMESLEVDARVGGVYVPPSPWHSGTDNSMDIMYDGLEETALFPPSAPVASTPPCASTAAVSSAAFLPTQVLGKEAAARDSMSRGESMTLSSPSSAMLAPPLPPASHSAAEPRSARTQQSGSRSHSAEKSGRSGQSQGSEVRSSGEGSKGVESVEYQQLQEKYRVLRKNMVALCRSSQSEMQSKLRTIGKLRAALKEKESRCVVEGGGTLQSDTCQDQSAGSNAFLNGNFSLPALSSSQRPEGSRLPQSQSSTSGGSSKTTEALAGMDGAPPSVSERVSAKPKMYSSVSVQTCVPENQAQTEAPRTSNKRVQTSSWKLVRRHTQTDLLKPVHASVQTDMLVNLKRLMTASLGLVDKPVQTDSASHLTVDKPAQTCTQRLVSKSVETDFDVVVDEPILRDSVRRGSVNEVHYVDCVMDMDAEKPLHGHSPDHTEDRSPTAVREVACIRAELKERDEAVQSRGAECAHRFPTDQAGPGKVTQYTCSSTASRKRLCDPFSEPEFGERKRVRRRLSSDERQAEYLSDADHDSVFDPRTDGPSHGGNVSVYVKSHCDPCSPAHSGEFHTVYDEHVDTVSILDTGNDALDLSMSGSASGVIVSEQERTSGQCFLSTAHPSTKQETPAPARASKMHSPENTDKEQGFTQGDKDTVPPRAGQGARVIPSGKQPLTRPATLGCLQDIKGQAWKRMLLLWSCFAHKTVSRREEIDAVFFGKENPKVYDWSRLELEQDPTNRDPTQISPHKHDSSHLTHPHEATTDKLKFGKSLEKENDLAQHQHAAVELPDAEGCSVTFEGSSPNIGEAETDNPNLTSSVSTSSATGSVHKQKKKKKKKDKKKDRHSTEKVDEKREKKRKKRKKKDDSSMKDQESVEVRKESEVDWKPPEGNDATSKWKTVDEVDRTASVKDADGFTEAHEEAEGNDCSTYIKGNVLPSAEIPEEDADSELTAGPETMSEVLKSTPGPYSCGTDGEKSALCLGQKDQTLIDKRTVSANQKGREVVDNVTVNTRQEDGEIDGIRKTSQENKAVSSDEIGTSPEGQSAHDTSDETVSDFSIHTDDSDSEGCPVKKMTENKPKIGCVSKDEDETVDDAAHDVDLIKDDILEDGADTHAGACVDDLVGPVEDDNMSEASDESADVNEGDMPDDHRTLCRQPTFKSNSTNSLKDGIEPMPEDDLAQDWLSSAHECASRGIVADINESTHSIDCTVEECEDSSRQQQDETAHMSVADRNSPWSQLHSAGVGKADSGTEGTQAFSPSLFSKEVTSEGGDLRTTGKDMSPEERNSTSVDLSNMPTTLVRSRHPPVTPKKNWLLRTAVAVGEGEESTLFGSAMRTAATRDLFDPSLIWSPEKTSHNTLSLREPISIDTFNNMLGMASNSTSSEESLARSVPFTDPQSGGMAARSQRSGKTVWTSSERLKADVKCPSGLQQAQKDSVLEVAKPCQPVQSNQQTSDRQTAVDQGQEERRLDMEGGVEAEETQTHAMQQPVEMDDKTPLFGYPSTVGLRDSATHCFHYKRRLPHLPPSSSSSASSTTASRSSSLTSASLSSLSTEPPPASLQPSLTSRLSQKLETVEEDRLDEERGNVEDYTSKSVEQSSSGLALLPKDTLPSRKEGALLVSRQAFEEMAHTGSEEQLPSTRSSEQKNCAKDVREHVFDDSLKETLDSTCVDIQGENGIPLDSDYHDAVSHSRTASQLCTGIAQSAQTFSPLSPLSEQRSGQSQVNLPEDADSLTSCVTEVGTSASAVRLQRKELEDGEIDSRDSLCQTPSYTQVGNAADNFTPTLMDITEQSLEEGEIRSGDESDTSEDEKPPGDEVIISVQSGDDIDVQSGDDINEDTYFEDMRDQLTRKGKRPRSPNTSKRMAPTLKKLKSGTQKDPSHVESHGQAHNPKAAVPKSKRGEEKRKASRREESEAGLCEDKENGKLDKQAQERRQRNRERLDKVRLQIVGHKQPRNKHSGLKSFTIPKVNRSSGSSQIQKDQNLSSENAHKASVHFASSEKEGDGVQDSTQCSRHGGKTETRREKEGRVRQEMDSSRERRLGDERDGKQRKYSEERDGKHRRLSEERDGQHRRLSEERDGKHRKYSEERDGKHRRCSEERDGKHRKYSEERDGKHRKYSEERDGKHRRCSEERDGKHRRCSEERDGKHRKYSEERDGKHRKYSEERDCKHRRLSEERDGKHRRLSKERDITHRRRSKESNITHRRPSKESNITHRRRSEERDSKYREHSEERNVRHRRHSKERDITHRRHSNEERDIGHRRHSEEERDIGHRRHSEEERDIGHIRHSEEERDIGHRRHSEEERDIGHRRHSEEERDIGHRRHSEEERDIGHRRHSEEGDSRHRRYGSEGDRDRRGSEERNGGHRRHSEERDRHRRHSQERDGRHRRHSNEGDSRRDSEERSGRTRRLSEEDRRHSRVKEDRDRRENKAGESRDRLPSKDGGDDRGYSREEGGRDRRSEKEQSSKYVKERDNKDVRPSKLVEDKTTEHGKQRDSQRATFRQERDDRSAARHSVNSADTGGKRNRADNQSVVARPHLSSPSSGGADVRCDNTESPCPSITSETGHFTSHRVDNSLRLRLSADRQNVPSNSGEAVQSPSESSAGRRQLPNQSSVKDKRSGNERSVQDEESFNDRLSENRPPPQGELIPAESPDSDPRVTEQQSSEQGLENDEHLSDPSQSEEETDSDGSFSVSDTDSESSDSLSRLAIEGSMRTRGFIYDRDPFKPRPELEMSFEDEEEEELEEQGNSGTKEEQTGSKSEDSEQEDDEDSCDEEDSGEENMSDADDDYDDDDDDNDAGQSKPNEAADTDTDDNEGDRGRPKSHDGKNRNQNTGPAQGEDPSCHDSDVEVFESEGSDISQSTGDCMELCTGTSMHSVDITSGFHVLGHGQKLMAEELGDVNEKTGHCTERLSSGKGRVSERLGHCEERHSSGKGKVLERLDSPGGKHHPVQPHSPVGQQGSSDCLSLHPWDDAENFLLGDLSHPQDNTLQPAADGPRAAGRRRNPNSSECSITGKKSCQSTAAHRGSFPGVGHNQVNKKLPAESQTAENSSQRRDRTSHHHIVRSSGVGSSHYQTSEQGSKSKTLPLSKRYRQGESSPTLDKASRCKSSIPKHRSSSRSSSVDSSKENLSAQSGHSCDRSDSSDRERDRRPCLSSASPCRTCEKHRRRTVDGVASTSGRRKRRSSSEASSPHRHEQRSRTVRSRQHWRDRKRSGEDRPHFPERRHLQGAADRAKKCDLTRRARGHHSSREHRVRDSGQPHRYPGGTRRLCGRECRHCDCCSSGFKAKHIGDCCHRDIDDRGCSDVCRRTDCGQGQKCYNDRRKSRSPLKCCTRSRC